MHIHQGSMERPPDWRREERQVGSNSDYGAWNRGGHVLAKQHQNDLRRARSYVQFGGAIPSSSSYQEARELRSSPPAAHGEEGDVQKGTEGGCAERWQWGSASHLRGQRDEQQSRGHKKPPKAILNVLLGPGDVTPSQGFPGAPCASRGVPNGGHVLWSFERCPSVLHGPLDRDRGKRGRPCAGDPPAIVARKEAAKKALTSSAGEPTQEGWHTPQATIKLPKSRSESALPVRWPTPRKVGGLQGLAGVSWDDAKVAAGGALRGSDGRYLGY